MATTTTKLGLVKPDYTDVRDINVINDNMDVLDEAVLYDASGNINLISGKRLIVDGSTSAAAVAVKAPLATTGLISGRVTTDTQSRFYIEASGLQQWGPGGATVVDTNLYRSAADTLKTDDTFVGGTDVKAGSGLISLLAAPRGVVGYNERTTIISTVGPIARVLSTRAPVVSGRTYRITVMSEIDTNIAPSTSQNEIRITTDDTEPTTSSPVLNRTLVDHRVNSVPDGLFIEAFYRASSSGFLRACFCITRVIGTGAIGINAAATFPTTITIADVGLTIASSGTVY